MTDGNNSLHNVLQGVAADNKQEAQLPLRNRASAMYSFVAKLDSIAVMTYSYV